MTGKRTNKISPEGCERAVRMVFDHELTHPSRWATVVSIAAVKKAEVNSGKRAGGPT